MHPHVFFTTDFSSFSLSIIILHYLGQLAICPIHCVLRALLGSLCRCKKKGWGQFTYVATVGKKKKEKEIAISVVDQLDRLIYRSSPDNT